VDRPVHLPEQLITQRYPFTAQTKAREMPVLPPVYSTTVIPGVSAPRR
jgi:hypothetical protein